MSVQRAEVHWARYLDGNRRVVLEADHARIVAEMEQAHAAALAEATRESAAHHYRMGKARGADLALNYDVGDEVMSDISAPKMSANDAIGDILRFNIDSDAAAPRTLTRDGWWPFGSFVDYDFPLEFDGEGEDGLPIWERPDKSRLAPRTLTADDPEPAVGSVVLGRYEISGQRVMDDDEETTIWRFSDGGWCYEWVTVQRMYGPVTLIHDGGAS